jgi:hypothetical protein
MFSVGILYSAKEFLDFLSETPGIDLTFSAVFQTFSVASPKAVLEVAQKCEWVQLNTAGQLEITDRGKQVIECKEPELTLRVQIRHLIEAYRPTWIPLLSRGRSEAQKYLPSDVAQCLREAALFTSLSDDVVNWWDECSKISRRAGKDTKIEVGRQGEKLSIQYERNRTKREPIWQGFESNLSGFDVLSSVSETDLAPLRIEVKTSNSKPEVAAFHVTKNELGVATTSGSYVFHLWSLQPHAQLMVVEVSRVMKHIPSNHGEGL